MTPTALKRIGADASLIKRAAFVSATAVESPRRTLLVMRKARFGCKGMPRHLVEQIYADYLRLGSTYAVAPIYGRTAQSIWELLKNHGYTLKPDSKALRKQGVTVDGVLYTPSGKGGHLRGTTGERRNLRNVIWERANGPLPSGWEIVMRDGNPLNCALENLHAGPKAEITRWVHLRRLGRAGETKEQQRDRRKRLALERYYRLREEYRQQGLRCDGKPLVTAEEHAQRIADRRAQRLAALPAKVNTARKRLTPTESAYAALKAEIEQAGNRDLPVACGFRDTDLNQRSAELGRANKKNFAGFKLKEAA